jgi:hypothetical protein
LEKFFAPRATYNDVSPIARSSSLEGIGAMSPWPVYHAPEIRTVREMQVVDHLTAIFGERKVLARVSSTE